MSYYNRNERVLDWKNVLGSSQVSWIKDDNFYDSERVEIKRLNDLGKRISLLEIENHNLRQMLDKDRMSPIVDINVIVPNKVVEITFENGYKCKLVCKDEDEFSLERACYIAIAKQTHEKDLTIEGIENLATQLTYYKAVRKRVNEAIKQYHKKLDAIEKERMNELESKRIKENRKRRKIAYKKRRKERERAARIAEQKEAYVTAMKEIQNSTENN